MPDYKKRRRHNTISSLPKNNKKKTVKVQEDIEMISSNPKTNKKKNDRNIRVLNGKKIENRRKFKIIMAICALAVVFVLIFNLIFPAGIIEIVSNKISLLGSGSYPIELETAQVINTVSKDAYYYVLTEGNLFIKASNGKNLMQYSHGFENPVLKVSDTRALLFEQGGNKAQIFGINDLILSVDTKNSIITGNISDSGAFAIATRSAQYTSEVLVYNKKAQVIYKWYSAEEIVNNVALSPNGKKLVVSTFNSNIGEYHSTVRVLNYKSANPDYTRSYNNTLIYEINSGHNGNFAVVTSNNIDFIKWSNYKIRSHKNDYGVYSFTSGNGGYLAVFNRESDRTDNNIAVFSKSGKLKYKFKFKGIITDAKLYHRNVYCLNDTDIFILSEDGNVLMRSTCGFGAVNISVTSSNTVAVVTNNNIEKVKLKKE